MSKSFNELKEKSIQIPKMKQWELYDFLFNLKSIYKEGIKNYVLNIKQDFNLEVGTSYIKEILTVPEAFRNEDLFKTGYKDPSDLTDQELYNDYADYLSNEIIKGLNLFNIKIIYKNINTVKEESLMLSSEYEGNYNLYGNIQYIIFIDDIVINKITNWFLSKYDKIAKKPIDAFLLEIKEEHTKNKRPNSIIHIDKIEGFDYDKIKNGIWTLFYTDKIKSFKPNGKGFDVELYNDNDKTNYYISGDLAFGIKENGILIIKDMSDNKVIHLSNQSDFGKILIYCFKENIKGPIKITEIYEKINNKKNKVDAEESFRKGKSNFINTKNISKNKIDKLIDKEKGNKYSVVLDFQIQN